MPDEMRERARKWLETQDECRRSIRDADEDVLAEFAREELRSAAREIREKFCNAKEVADWLERRAEERES